jgi:transposase
VLLPRQRAKLARGAQDKEHAMSQTLETSVAVIGVDIGKNSFHLVGQDRRGAIVLRQKWSRGQVEARLANLPPCASARSTKSLATHGRTIHWVDCSA